MHRLNCKLRQINNAVFRQPSLINKLTKNANHVTQKKPLSTLIGNNITRTKHDGKPQRHRKATTTAAAAKNIHNKAAYAMKNIHSQSLLMYPSLIQPQPPPPHKNGITFSSSSSSSSSSTSSASASVSASKKSIFLSSNQALNSKLPSFRSQFVKSNFLSSSSPPTLLYPPMSTPTPTQATTMPMPMPSHSKPRRSFSSNAKKVVPKWSVRDCTRIPCGQGVIVDTMLSDTEVKLHAKDFVPMDGNTTAAYIAYANCEVSFIYPISPATSMGEAMDTFASAGKTNCISHQPVRVEVMQSEGGAAGAVHGALAAGAMSSTFTASQGLLLMIPNMYLIAGELMPCVFHISARTLAKQALCIYNDHSDVMAVRQTGWALLCSNNAQEVMDLGLVSHLATVKSRIPFLHFFDGNRTSHEIQKIHRIPYEDIEKLIRLDLIDQNLRSLSLSPVAPIVRGTGQRPDIFFQSNMASERFYRAAPQHIESCMQEVEAITGRRYNLFDYYGHPEADKVIIIMGSAAQTTQQLIQNMVSNGEKVGVVKVRAYRPWSPEHFFAAVPETVTKVAVIDRTREEGALGNPLFLDVSVSMRENPLYADASVIITGGAAGLGQKEITPSMMYAAFENLDAVEPRMRYTLGINDDVTFTSLPYDQETDYSMPASTRQCCFWGLGSDGTVGANKEAIKMIGDHTPLNCQGFFAYDSKKSGGVTWSQLRFGPEQMHAEYQIRTADYIAVHNLSKQFLKLDLLKAIKTGGTVVFNSSWNTPEELAANLPARMLNTIARNDAILYNIDAGAIARSVGLKGRINMIMQSVFYKVGDVIPAEEATDLLKSSIKRMFGKKGEDVVNMNINAVEQSQQALVQIQYPKEQWLTAVDKVQEIPEWDALLLAGVPDFVGNVMDPCMQWDGEDLPVSAFTAGGQFPVGTTRYERRGAAPEIPLWLPDKCTQCNYCAIVCPHAVIRPFLLSKEDVKNSPDGFLQRKAQGPDMGGLNFTIQVSPFDCTGCEVCVQSCPDDALYMADFTEFADATLPHFEFAMTLPNRQPMDKFSVKGSQFEQPLLEFHCACAGCGETPYVKLVTQLFGQEMMIANASGCSSVWGGTATTHPYTINKESGRGPAWGRSLFEDNAEYGYGMLLASLQRRQRLYNAVNNAVQNIDFENEKLLQQFRQWLKTYNNFYANLKVCDDMEQTDFLAQYKDTHPVLHQIHAQRDLFRPRSQWLIGGDGWAYDIGQGGLDHILSKGENLNVLVLDTEIYSNTGGQSSKSSVAGQVTKFESLGKVRHKKDLGQVAVNYNDIYVASVSLGADYNQCVKAFKEACEYPGTSLIMAYSPCIDWGIDMKEMINIEKAAVDTGYWQLYRYDPRLQAKGANPMQLDSKRIKKDLKTYLNNENRFRQLQREHKERAELLQGGLEVWVQDRHQKILRQSMDDLELLDFLKNQLGHETSEKILVLYASETGNAAEFSKIVGSELEKRGVRAKVMACDDYDIENLGDEKTVIFILATCGQGELPANCRDFYASLTAKTEESSNEWLADVQMAVFGMGDSHYVYFNEVATLFDTELRAKGAQMVIDAGMGDDQDPEKFESVFEEWGPDLFTKLELPEAQRILLPSQYAAQLLSNDTNEHEASTDIVLAPGAKLVECIENRLLTPVEYERDTRHYEFDTGAVGMSYEVGDSLGIYPTNDSESVSSFLSWYGMNDSDIIRLTDETGDAVNALPEYVSVHQLFSQVLDIFGRPKRRFYELLSLVASDDNEKTELEAVLARANSDERYQYNIANTQSHADLLQKYQSARPSIGHLIDYVPRIKPRLYSIASSPNEQPDEIALCIIMDDWTTPDTNEYRRGLCSSFLTQKSRDGTNRDMVVAKVNSGVVAMPSAASTPMVMAGLGTGLAPLRGMVRDRMFSHANGEKVGEMALYFGARHRKDEFLYESEWEEFHDSGKGPLRHLRPAFSRDQPHKVYIQDKIKEDADMLYQYLVKENGYFYACGSGAVQDLKKYVAECLSEAGNMSIEEGEQYVTQMMIEGRYCIESW